MKKFPALGLVFTLTWAFTTGPVLRAQDQPPPPPEQLGDQGAPPDQAGDPGAPPGADAPDGSNAVSFQTFYDQLGSQGSWLQTDEYGYVWQPNVQDPNWSPYSNGHWVYTDEGWTWIAADSEPWGWATYHYGRWVNLDGEGWAWVPGYTWAPAWVSWRYGGGYCGWAPLPPETTVGIDFGDDDSGFHIGGDCDDTFDIGPGYYNFVPVIYIGAGDYRPYYANRYSNYTIINNTRNVTNINVASGAGAGRFGRVTAGGPNFATLNAQARTPIARASLVATNRVGNATLRGNRLAVFAPPVTAASGARPARVSATLSTVRVNRGTSITQPLIVSPRLQTAGPSAQQVQAAGVAAAQIPRTAQVATTGTQPAQPLATPLTALQPHAEAEARRTGTASDTVRPAATTTSIHSASVPHADAERERSAFPSGTPEATRPHTPNESFTPSPAPVSRQQYRPSNPVERESTPVEHRQEAPSFRPAATPQAVHRADASPPAQHADAAQHPSGGGSGGGQSDDKKK